MHASRSEYDMQSHARLVRVRKAAYEASYWLEAGTRTDRHNSGAPLLGENPADAQRLAIGGRPIRLLKEAKAFDTERLADLPLFAPKGLFE